MKKILVIALLLITGLFMVFNSCKEDEYIYLSEEFKSYVIFPEGTYWVYEEIKSGFIDTLNIEEVSISFGSGHSESHTQYESGVIEYNTSRSGLIHGYISPKASIYGCSSYHDLLTANKNEDFVEIDSVYMGLNLCFFCCCDTGIVMSIGTKYLGMIDTMIINSLVFEKVMNFSNVSYDSLEIFQHPNRARKSYYAKNIGLIKWEQFNGNVWEIRDYMINN